MFDVTLIGINDTLWDPNFIFPVMGSLLMMVSKNKHMVDIYVGDMFYNFRLCLVMENYCGVDLGSYLGYRKDHQGTTIWMLWVCPMMGLVLSPYAATQGLLWSSEVLMGYKSDYDNPLMWDKVILNLNGDPQYPPHLPVCQKLEGKI